MGPNTSVNPLRSHPPSFEPAQRPAALDSQSAGQSGRLFRRANIRANQQGGQKFKVTAPAPIRPVVQLSKALEKDAASSTNAQQRPHGESRRVALADEDLRALPESASQDGSQTGDGKREADGEEPKFPELVYNILLVGAAGVGQTSMILYVLIPTASSSRSC